MPTEAAEVASHEVYARQAPEETFHKVSCGGMSTSPAEGGGLGLSSQARKKKRNARNAWHSSVLSDRERELYHAIMKAPTERLDHLSPPNGIRSLLDQLFEILKEKEKVAAGQDT